MAIVWDGIISVDMLHADHAETRHGLADAAKRYDWMRVMAILGENSALVNTTRPGGASLLPPTTTRTC